LLAFSRRQPLMPEIVDLDSVLNNVRELVPGLLGDQIDLSITSASDLGLVKADPNQLAQVIVNFAVNARDAMPQGGSLTVAARDGELGDALRRRHPEAPEGRYGIIDVRDTGCGMDQGTLSRLYEPFFTTKEPGQGTGLGLAMAYGVVQESGGYIDVESQVGQGSTFSVYLPHTDEPLEPLVADPEVTVTGGTETLLVVEDTVDVKELAVETLEECGFTVLSAAGAAEALVTVLEQDRPIDLLVTDVAMPEMNGVDLARRLRASRPDLPVLFISGYPDDMLSRYGMQAPRTAMLPKPFLPDRLAVKIRELLDSQ